MLVAEPKAEAHNTTEASIIPEIRKNESNIVLLYIVFNEIRKKHNLTLLLKIVTTYRLGLIQTPYFSCAEPNCISSTLERHWRDI